MNEAEDQEKKDRENKEGKVNRSIPLSRVESL